MWQVQTILAPVDFSDASHAALEAAFALARQTHAHLVVLHVAWPPDFITYTEFEKVLQQSSGQRRALEKRLRECQQPDCNAEFRLEDGLPAESILRVAQETHCDLIVMGTHGRTGLGRVLMGSVAEAVLRRAPCPVLTIKPPASGSQAFSSATETAVGIK